MELALQIQVEQLPEGMFLATSEQLPGLIAQGRTVAETLEIARDVARKLIESRRETEKDIAELIEYGAERAALLGFTEEQAADIVYDWRQVDILREGASK